MNKKLLNYKGKTVSEYIKLEKVSYNKAKEPLDPIYLNEIIDEDYFVCENCHLPMHDSNLSSNDTICTVCESPHLWNK